LTHSEFSLDDEGKLPNARFWEVAKQGPPTAPFNIPNVIPATMDY
jgi:hypothetical protein